MVDIKLIIVISEFKVSVGQADGVQPRTMEVMQVRSLYVI